MIIFMMCSSAYGFIENPRLEPINPSSDDNIQFVLDTGECHLLYTLPQDYTVTIDNNDINIHAKFIDNTFFPAFCNLPSSTQFLDIGKLSPNEYHLNFVGVDDEFPDTILFEYGTNFTVIQGIIYSIPSSSNTSLFFLMALVCLSVYFRFGMVTLFRT